MLWLELPPYPTLDPAAVSMVEVATAERLEKPPLLEGLLPAALPPCSAKEVPAA
jgi:hypothetical protein